jgi:hypothetical protein
MKCHRVCWFAESLQEESTFLPQFFWQFAAADYSISLVD